MPINNRVAAIAYFDDLIYKTIAHPMRISSLARPASALSNTFLIISCSVSDIPELLTRLSFAELVGDLAFAVRTLHPLLSLNRNEYAWTEVPSSEVILGP